MGLRADVRKATRLARELIAGRRIKRALQARYSDDDVPSDKFKIGVYFADEVVNLYQLRQWYAPLSELSQKYPVLVMARKPRTVLKLLEESPIPVAYAGKVADLESVIAKQDLRIILYVNQNSQNFQMMRYGQRWHVFINHGESDKMYMTTNQFKAYDFALIAGEAARDRLQKSLWNYDLAERAIAIGRPQADHYLDARAPIARDDKEIVLYAPTWEGDRPAAAYSSIVSHGEQLVMAILNSGRHRIIYRPHPRSGVLNSATAAANKRIIAAIARANARDQAAGHIYDDSSDLSWQLAIADIAVVDVSAMVYDRLAVGKPLLVTRPLASSAAVDLAGYLGACDWLDAADGESMLARIDTVARDADSLARLDHWAGYNFGDITKGVATARFHDAIEYLMAEWERYAAGEQHTAGEDVVLTEALSKRV